MRRLHALRRRYGHAARKCPVGSRVQTLLFPRGKFTTEEARLWATHHGFHGGKADVTSKYVRLRQESPTHFRRMRTIRFGSGGVMAVVGWARC